MGDHLPVRSKLKAWYRSENAAHACSFFVMLGLRFRNRQALSFCPQHRGRTHRLRGLIPLLILPLTLGGCYWLKYEKLMHTHIELMLSMTNKMSRLLGENDPITPTMMNEFLYPLERARDFARIVAKRYTDRPSLAAFHQLLDIYEGIVTEVDRLRLQPGNLDDFQARAQALRDQVTQVERALSSE